MTLAHQRSAQGLHSSWAQLQKELEAATAGTSILTSGSGVGLSPDTQRSAGISRGLSLGPWHSLSEAVTFFIQFSRKKKM